MTDTSPSTEHKAPKKTHYPSSVFGKLGLGVSLLAIGASLYSIHYNQRSDLRLGMQQEQLHNSIQNLEQSQSALRLEINSLKQLIENIPPKTANDTGTSQESWYINEVVHMLRLAIEQLQKNSDPSLAELLVSKSIGLLKASGQANIQPSADRLVNALTLFQTEYRMHLTRAMKNLDALQNQSTDLVIKEPHFTPGNTAPVAPTGDNPKLWRDKLKESLNLLEKVIVVRKQDDSVNPLLLPLYQKIVLESIRMNLQEAQWALLNHNTALYAQSLTQVEQEFARYTDNNAPVNQSFASKLQAAKQADNPLNTDSLTAAVSAALQTLEQADAADNTGAEDAAQ